MEYATGWLVSRVVPTTSFEHVGPLLEFIENTFGRPCKYVSDNHNAFVGKSASKWHASRGTIQINITPQRPRGNGKVEQANGELKYILNRLVFERPNSTYESLLNQLISIYNRRVGPNGYRRFFLVFGTKPPLEHQIYLAYEREPSASEDKSSAAELAKMHAAPPARVNVASLKSACDQTRAHTQEEKALIRVYGT